MSLCTPHAPREGEPTEPHAEREEYDGRGSGLKPTLHPCAVNKYETLP
jgi:hypothetical protein